MAYRSTRSKANVPIAALKPEKKKEKKNASALISGRAADDWRDVKIKAAFEQLRELGAKRATLHGRDITYRRWNHDKTIIVEIHKPLFGGVASSDDEDSISFDADEDTTDFNQRQEEERNTFEHQLDEKQERRAQHREWLREIAADSSSSEEDGEEGDAAVRKHGEDSSSSE
jgi:hypothetical protein